MKTIIILLFSFSINIFSQSIWNTQFSPSYRLWDLCFINNLTGWTSGNNGTIFKTTNGGINWVYQFSGTTAHLKWVFFINENTGWAGGTEGRMTTDGGITWGPAGMVVSYGITDVYFINDNTGWSLSPYQINKTTNMGSSWFLQFLANDLLSIQFLDPVTGWTCGSLGKIGKTTNGGGLWINQNSGTTIIPLYEIKFVNYNTGWVVGGSGFVSNTTNGGNNWIRQNSHITGQLNGCYFVDSIRGRIVGSNGVIRRTTNGGLNWFSENSGTTSSLFKVSFPSRDTGYIVGGSSSTGIILNTTTGENIILTPPDYPLNLNCTPVSSTSLILNWTDDSFNEDGFRIENRVGNTWYPYATVGANETSFLIEGLEPLYCYYFRVYAYNAAGNSAESNTAWACTPAATPSAPANFAAVADSTQRINLSWIDNSNNEGGFVIERSTDEGNNWSPLYTTVQNVVSCPDTGLTPYSVYFYRVYAFNSSGNSPYSNIAWDTARSYKSCDNISILISKINELKNANVINQGQANSLIVKLNSACEHSNRGQFNSAINQMGAFINQVNAFINAEIFTQAQADPLINIANDIILLLQNGTSPLKTAENSGEIPQVFALYNNYPNPFNPNTVISFQLAVNSFTSIKIFDILGKEIATLVNENLNAGTYKVDWNASGYSSGVYFYRIETGYFTDTKKMLIVK